MKSRISRMLALAGVAALVSAGCNVNPQQASEAAQRVMTVAAQITPGAVETVIASSPLGTAAPVAPAQAPLVYARCITRGETALLQSPGEGAMELAALASRSIITAFGRTADATWVLGWDASDVRGWLPAAIIGCTAPVQDLRATDAGFLLTPTVAATQPPTSESTTEATAEATLPASVLTDTATVTAETTPEMTATEAAAQPATEAATQAPTETPLPPATTASATETPLPATATRAPTVLPTGTPAPTATAVSATAAAPARVITVVVTATPAQVRDLRCIVTPGTPVNLRSGPARADSLLATLPAGTRFLAQGRNADATWLYGFTEFQMPGWLIASSVECDGNPAQLVEVDR
jgi:hypothetical protein